MTREQEKKVIEGVLSNDRTSRNTALELIYKHCYSRVEALIIKNNGSHFDSKDIFQEGVMIMYQNVRDKKFKAESSIFTYLYSICRNLWLLQLRQGAMKITDDQVDENSLSYEEVQKEQVNLKAIRDLVIELKEDCKRMLSGFYYEMKSMKELAKVFKLGSEQAAKNKKSRCLKHLTKMISKKGLDYEHFIQ